MAAHCCEHHHDPGGDPARQVAYRRVLWAVLAINAVMFAVEIGAGLAAGSAALQADALDFLADAANYAISLFVVGMALRYRAIAALTKGATMSLSSDSCRKRAVSALTLSARFCREHLQQGSRTRRGTVEGGGETAAGTVQHRHPRQISRSSAARARRSGRRSPRSVPETVGSLMTMTAMIRPPIIRRGAAPIGDLDRGR